jgi:hypothetical protein
VEKTRKKYLEMVVVSLMLILEKRRKYLRINIQSLRKDRLRILSMLKNG